MNLNYDNFYTIGSAVADEWQQCVVVYDPPSGANGMAYAYYNGVQVGSWDIWDYDDTSDIPVYMASLYGEDGRSYWTGGLDEARVSNTVRSPAWIETQYANQSSPDTFYSVGENQVAYGVTLNTQGYDISVAGDYNNQFENATLNDVVGTTEVIFTGTDTSTVYGANTFPNLTCDLTLESAGKQIIFPAGDEQTVSGTLTLTGEAGKLITLRSSEEDSQWSINVTSSAVNFVDVQDSIASGAAITANTSKDSGNNVNWIFPATTLTWNAGASTTDWGTGSNWDLGYVPNSSDNAVITDTSYDPVLDAAREVVDLTINSNAILSLKL